MLETYDRPLSDQERRWIQKQIATNREDLRRLVPNSCFASSLLWGLIWIVVAIAAHGAGWRGWLIQGALCAGMAICYAVGFCLVDNRKLRKAIRHFEATLAENQARVVHIVSNRVVKMDEQDEEGAHFAFELGDNRIVFVYSEIPYATARFPNSDFELVDILGPDGRVVRSLTNKLGDRLQPVRRMRFAERSRLRVANHLEVITGSLDDLDQLLAKPAGRGG